MKQTAVEWFNEEILIYLNFDQRLYLKKIFEKAKEMEKEQIIEAYRDGRSDQQSARNGKFYSRMAEQYYNETFKSE